jgi:hypothetical protein
MSTLHRTQILLEPEQHRALAKMARRTGRSMSDVAREILGEALARQEREASRQRALQAIEWLSAFREEIRARHGVLQRDFVAEGREERAEEIERVMRGEQ